MKLFIISILFLMLIESSVARNDTSVDTVEANADMIRMYVKYQENNEWWLEKEFKTRQRTDGDNVS